MSADVVIARLRGRDMLDLVREVCAANHVTIGQVCGRARHASITVARHAVWTIIRSRFGLSYPEIGELFGVDHATVMHGVKKARPRIDACAARAALRVI
jgi:chromosomal replication initiation ATPase DnaA